MLLLAALLVPSACEAPPTPSGPTDMVLRIADREAFLDGSLSLLRRYDLPPERVDRTRGLIVTRRATSGQWCEPWRVDSRGAYQLLESSLHTVARVVTVTVEPVDAPQAADAAAIRVQTQPSGAPLAERTADAGPPTTTPADRYRVTVRVDKSRYSAPERQITTASGALGIYSERIPTTEGVLRSRRTSVHWVLLGRDALLEAFLLDKLAGAAREGEPAE